MKDKKGKTYSWWGLFSFRRWSISEAGIVCSRTETLSSPHTFLHTSPESSVRNRSKILWKASHIRWGVWFLKEDILQERTRGGGDPCKLLVGGGGGQLYQDVRVKKWRTWVFFFGFKWVKWGDDFTQYGCKICYLTQYGWQIKTPLGIHQRECLHPQGLSRCPPK